MRTRSFIDDHEERERARRSRSIRVGVISAVAILLLTLGVFSIGQASERLTQRAAEVQAYDELAQTTAVIRAQLGFSVVLADLGAEAQTDVSSAVNSNAADVDDALGALAMTVDTFEANFGDLETDLGNSIASFVTSANQLRSAFNDPAIDPAVASSFDRSYEDARTRIGDARSVAVGRVTDADATLGRLGTLVSFVVAFVIPTVALFLYRELTRPRNELASLRAEAADVRERDLIANALTRGFAEQLQPITMSPKMHRDLTHLTTTLDVLNQHHRVEFASVDSDRLVERVEEVFDELTHGRGSVICSGDDSTRDLWIDLESAAAAIDWLVSDSVDHGANTITVTVAIDTCDGSEHQNRSHPCVRFDLTHDGVPRSSRDAGLALDRRTIADRMLLAAGTAGTPLVIAGEMLQATGGSLEVTEDEHSAIALTVRLPMKTLVTA